MAGHHHGALHRALGVQHALAQRGQHRTPLPDLALAATGKYTMRLLAIAGSPRAGSHNRQLLRQAKALALASGGVDWREWDGLAVVAAFSEDDEHAPVQAVRVLRAAIADADAVLLATPEYNGSVAGGLKNVVDWASRPPGAGVWTGKPSR